MFEGRMQPQSHYFQKVLWELSDIFLLSRRNELHARFWSLSAVSSSHIVKKLLWCCVSCTFVKVLPRLWNEWKTSGTECLKICWKHVCDYRPPKLPTLKKQGILLICLLYMSSLSAEENHPDLSLGGKK